MGCAVRRRHTDHSLFVNSTIQALLDCVADDHVNSDRCVLRTWNALMLIPAIEIDVGGYLQ